MKQALTLGLAFAGDPIPGLAPPTPRVDLPPIHGGFPGASGPRGRCTLINRDLPPPLYAKSSTPSAPSASSGGRSSASSAIDSRRKVSWCTRARCSPSVRGPPSSPTSCPEICQLLPPLRGALRRAGGAVKAPEGALHVDRCRTGELRRTEAGPLLGPGTGHV